MTGAHKAQLLNIVGGASTPFNFVAQYDDGIGNRYVSGGFKSGNKKCAPVSWQELGSAALGESSIEFILPKEQEYSAFPHDAGLMIDEVKKVGVLATASAARMGAKPFPPFRIICRIMPEECEYHFETHAEIKSGERRILTLLTTLPPRTDAYGPWARQLVMNAIHEVSHTVLWDVQRYGDLAKIDTETLAHTWGSCAIFLARGEIPKHIGNFPIPLEGVVARDISVFNLRRALLDGGEHHSYAGALIHWLAMKRYLDAVQRARGKAPGSEDLLPYCNAAANGALHFWRTSIDEEIEKIPTQNSR